MFQGRFREGRHAQAFPVFEAETGMDDNLFQAVGINSVERFLGNEAARLASSRRRGADG